VLDATDVKERLTHLSDGGYCALDGNVVDGTPVPYLDTVPPSIVCFPPPPPAGGGPGVGASR